MYPQKKKALQIPIANIQKKQLESYKFSFRCHLKRGFFVDIY